MSNHSGVEKVEVSTPRACPRQKVRITSKRSDQHIHNKWLIRVCEAGRGQGWKLPPFPPLAGFGELTTFADHPHTPPADHLEEA